MKRVIAYIKDSYNELVHKVSWPTKAELSNSAVVVMFASLIIAVLIGAIDFGFEAVIYRFFCNVRFSTKILCSPRNQREGE